jgi:hypothetical protein
MKLFTGNTMQPNPEKGTFEIIPNAEYPSPINEYELSFVNPSCKFNRCSIRIRIGEQREPIFGWDGNYQEPTITPSIGCDHRCGWHGFITNGEIK